jgi:hypothetical protein
MKRIVFAVAALFVMFTAGVVAANKFASPSSIVHIVTVQWKEDSTPEQRTAAIEGVRKMAGQIPGMKSVWLKAIKLQGGANAVLVMEFADQKSFDAYADHPAHREWENIYLPIRQRSTTFDVTN